MNPINTIHCAACYTAAQALSDRPELSERVRAAGMAIAEMDKDMGALCDVVYFFAKFDPVARLFVRQNHKLFSER